MNIFTDLQGKKMKAWARVVLQTQFSKSSQPRAPQTTLLPTEGTLIIEQSQSQLMSSSFKATIHRRSKIKEKQHIWGQFHYKAYHLTLTFDVSVVPSRGQRPQCACCSLRGRCFSFPLQPGLETSGSLPNKTPATQDLGRGDTCTQQDFIKQWCPSIVTLNIKA